MAHSAAGRFFWSAANTFRSSRLGGEESDVAEAWPLLQESLKEKSLKDGLSNSMANKGWGFPTQGLVSMQSVVPHLSHPRPLFSTTLRSFSSLSLSLYLSLSLLAFSFSPLFPFSLRRRPTRWFYLVLGGSDEWGGAFRFFFHVETSCWLAMAGHRVRQASSSDEWSRDPRNQQRRFRSLVVGHAPKVDKNAGQLAILVIGKVTGTPGTFSGVGLTQAHCILLFGGL